jgi:hypothetical protein
MFIRRRPLLRTAIIAGTAGAVLGHSAAKKSAREAQQEAQMAQMQQEIDAQQQSSVRPPAQPVPPMPTPVDAEATKLASLKNLKEMLDQGVLTQQEFNTEKEKVLHGA